MRLRVQDKYAGHTFQTVFEGMPLVLNTQWQFFQPRQCEYLQAVYGEYLESDEVATFKCDLCEKAFPSENGLYCHRLRVHLRERKPNRKIKHKKKS